MAKTYVDEIVGGDGKRRYNLVRDDGSMAAQNVQIVKAYTPEQEGSTFGAVDVYDLQCKEYTITLTADGWVDGQQTVSLPEIQVDAGTVFVGLPAEATLSEIQAAANVGIRCISRESGSLVFKVLGAKPTQDINIVVVLTGGYPTIINDIGGFGASDDELYITEKITASKKWTVPAGVTEIEVRLFGGGGGGGTSSSDECGGGGGGHMGYGKFTVTAGTQYAVTIGSGGRPGTRGGQTKFGDLLIAEGGQNGYSSGSGGSGGTGGGGAGHTERGGNATYGGGGGGGGDGGVYGGNSGAPGVESMPGANEGGGGGFRANGGASHGDGTYDGSGGGGGWEGGNGGDGGALGGGGGGGYGTKKIAANGSGSGGKGGLGYGAGGGGGGRNTGGNGAPGICIIKYRRS